MTKENEDKLKDTIRDTISGIILPTVVAIFMAISSWAGVTAVETLTKHGNQLFEISSEVKLFDQYIKDITARRDGELKAMKDILTDHEIRLRDVEKRTRRP